jgi:Zn-dependent M28 family amino/carboxypeptidase
MFMVSRAKKLAVALGLTTAVAVGLHAAPAERAAWVEHITARALRAHVVFLADDLLEGRAPGTRGGELAARYIATAMAVAGLSPGAPDGSFFQPVPIVETETDPSFTLRASGPGGQGTFAYKRDVMAYSGRFDATLPFEAELVFVGHGIVSPEYRWNDYEDVDVRGKVVLVMVNEPPATAGEPALFDGKALTVYGRWDYKYEEAARQGAAGAILIHTDESATYPWSVVESSWSGPQFAVRREGVPALTLQAWATEDAARRLAQLGGHDLDALRRAALSRGHRAVPLGVDVAGEVRQRVADTRSPNVIGYLEGDRPGEAIVVTAHYDHLGRREAAAGEDGIYNGARDNATGVAGILEIARAMAAAPERPMRRVYFVATTGEEAGLLGAEALVASPPLLLDRLVANVNIDALNVFGPTSEVVVLGHDRSTLGALVEQVASSWGRTVGVDPFPERGHFFRSDHYPFAKAGIPALSLSGSTKYVGPEAADALRRDAEFDEKHYHQPSDQVSDAWNFEAAAADMRIMADLIRRVAGIETAPAYLEGQPFRRRSERR